MKKWIPILLFVLALVTLGYFLFGKPAKNPQKTVYDYGPKTVNNPTIVTKAVDDAEPVQTETIAYISPVDFQGLHKINPDIYGWLCIPNTDISYPILQGKSNDAYLRHDEYHKESKAGCIFTENYNNKDFTDPVTVIYGHNMHDGTMFGSLQKIYTNQTEFDTHNEIIVYLPDSEKRYKIFAAVPYDSIHILYYYDFTQSRIFRAFFDDIMSVRALNVCFADDTTLFPNDHVVILSTCLSSDRSKRFLVCAKEVIK